MHYSYRVTARRYGLKTMRAKVNPAVNDAKMGWRNGLAQSDVDVLNRMYCTAPDCVDKEICCGMWALQNKCYKKGSRDARMAKECPKSGGFCKPILDEMQEMFPSIQKEMIRMVLEANGGNKDSTSNALIDGQPREESGSGSGRTEGDVPQHSEGDDPSEKNLEAALDELKEMFPSIQKEMLRRMLEANGGDNDSTADALFYNFNTSSD
uniref:CUE domain-containing protein n=1 Tax=Globodera rostochiensis TaxID=31243 RepID=A0A914H1I1_GLORO